MRFPLMAVAALALQLSESIEVRVVNVDVMVADRDGRPVTGLTKDDFEIFEDKKPQVITSFYDVRGGVPAESGAETRYASSIFAYPRLTRTTLLSN